MHEMDKKGSWALLARASLVWLLPLALTACAAPPAVTPVGAGTDVLRITPVPNGPLLVAGNLEVVSGTGRTTNRVERTALCRCGQSANKPYCDGSHTAAGFRAE
jgi:hypothetical protein